MLHAKLIRITILFLACLFPGKALICQHPVEKLVFENLDIPSGVSGNEVRQVYQDKEGFIWIATNSGLLRYDGHEYVSYKSNLHNRNLLTNNTIQALTEDNRGNLWIGSSRGLNLLHKPTGQISPVNRENLEYAFIQSLQGTRSGEVWIGTNAGLYRYVTSTDTFQFMGVLNVKTMIEDSRSNVWIGTWNQGFYRYEPGSEQLIPYLGITEHNSAHAITQDGNGNIWIGTWGGGLYRLHNPYGPGELEYTRFRHESGNPNTILDNVIYAIAPDTVNQTLWIGSRYGLSILTDTSDPYSSRNYLPGKGERSLSHNELNSIIRDKDGLMWLGLLGGGIDRVDPRPKQFRMYQTIPNNSGEALIGNSVRSLLAEEDGKVWIGTRNFGLFLHDRKDNTYVHCSRHPDLAPFSIPTVNALLKQSADGSIWIGTYGSGVFVYTPRQEPGKRVVSITSENNPALSDNCIYSLYEDRHGNIWIGTRNGITIVAADGTFHTYQKLPAHGNDFGYLSVISIGEDPAGNIWLGSDRNGAFRVTGNFRNPESFRVINYASENWKIHSNYISTFYADTKGRFWVGTEGEGLILYNAYTDSFETMHARYRLPGDAVVSIREDKRGSLWLGTNEGLIRLQAEESPEESSYHLFTTVDGLQGNVFSPNAVYRKQDEEMLFGGNNGYNSFYPQSIVENTTPPRVVVTDIKIFNSPWNQIEPKRQAKISTLAPGFTKKIVLSHRDNNLNIDFAVLSYAYPSQNKFAYRLAGFDADWKYTDANRRFAYYNNLKSGNYTFYLRGASEQGVWNDAEYPIEIVVKPAPWATWWAYLGYFLLAVAAIRYGLRIMQNRMKMAAAVKMAEMKHKETEELSHAKLQFFTNITHELMTPLTIISASLDELKMSGSESEQYETMSANAHRLMRLIRQILEFRKAESGNLKLKVSEGDISRFVKVSVDSFRPLVKKKNIRFRLLMEEEHIHGWFDPDKLDKILYNLLSNAAKYNHPEGWVQISLSTDDVSGTATISVKDNGEGISADGMKNLFKRFYEGNYRKFNTSGTGIGLSLTKDLVDLHKGTIEVESKKGEGATFTVTFPIRKEGYLPEEIDEFETDTPNRCLPEPQTSTENSTGLVPFTPAESPISGESPSHHLLLVEDNEELLSLMTRLFSREYRVSVARNGVKGLEVMESQEIDLIVSDVMMPDMDGIEMTRRIKAKFEWCHIPVILLTAKQAEEDRITGYDSGADSYIAKPFSLSLLQARIKGLLKNRERTARDFKKQMVLETAELDYTSMDEEFVQKAVDCVYRHLNDEGFDVEQFAEEMTTSKSTLYNKLKSLTGLHTTAFIRNIRLKAACRIIEEKKRVRISELAYAVGFNNAKYFSLCFKKEFGILPTEFMEQFREEK